jgi:hypothetical protein
MASSEGRRRALALALLAAAAIGAWHLSPVALWHLRFEHELSQRGDGGRLRTPSRSPGVAPDGWSGLRVANVSLRLPLRPEDRPLCATCSRGCVLRLAPGGTVAVFDAPPPESLGEALDLFAPSADDLSILRSVARNWQTIDALTERALQTSTPPTAFRFETAGSRGVVTGFEVNGLRRYVVYAYAHAGDPTRVLGVTGVSEADLDRILGSVRVSPAGHPTAARPGECA